MLDAGCAGGTLAWLTRTNGMAFGRVLALTVLPVSVLGNSIGHFLASIHLAPGWALVVATSALAQPSLGGGDAPCRTREAAQRRGLGHWA
ncbi:MAG TPA: hypothetical protein VFA63_12400 [Pseudonocardiaceae bacterium]|nr:hypothetical protein [Pseudonocardiaceae bacterium]